MVSSKMEIQKYIIVKQYSKNTYDQFKLIDRIVSEEKLKEIYSKEKEIIKINIENFIKYNLKSINFTIKYKDHYILKTKLWKHYTFIEAGGNETNYITEKKSSNKYPTLDYKRIIGGPMPSGIVHRQYANYCSNDNCYRDGYYHIDNLHSCRTYGLQCEECAIITHGEVDSTCDCYNIEIKSDSESGYVERNKITTRFDSESEFESEIESESEFESKSK